MTEADHTASGKAHFEVLDGLRGTAALLVVLFHIMGMPIAWEDEGQWLHHAALSVDFFFALSLALAAVAYRENSVDLGSDWDTMWMGSVRMGFSFTLGLWLYCIRGRMPVFRLGWLAASAVLAVLFALPLVPRTIPHGNGAYHLFLVMIVFPILILGGAHSEIGRRELALCKIAGRLSYPIYILHSPFLLLYMTYVTFTKPSAAAEYTAAATVLVLVIAFAWAALKAYDEPLRRRLKPLART